MISLKPREQFTIVRQLTDHTDLTTYYVQAVIRECISGDILETIRLTNDGNGRFTKIWEVPADVSEEGFFIDITISVYSDSIYSTKASAYGDMNDQYLVFDRMKGRNGGGGGYIDVDYKKIEKMLTKGLNSLPEVKMESMEPIKELLKKVMTEVKAIDIPKPEKTDLSPLIRSIITTQNLFKKEVKDSQKLILKEISDKPVTPSVDLAPVLKSIEKNSPQNLELLASKMQELRESLAEFIKYDKEKSKNTENTSETKLKKLAEMVMPVLSQVLPLTEEVKKPDRASRL